MENEPDIIVRGLCVTSIEYMDVALYGLIVETQLYLFRMAPS